MTRKAKIGIGSVLGGVALIGVTYLGFRPKWVTATRAEVDKVIDPILLKKDPADPAGEARYKRLTEILRDLPKPILPGASTFPTAVPGGPPVTSSFKAHPPTPTEISEDAQKYRSGIKAKLPEIQSILQAGPLKHAAPGFLVGTPVFSYFRTFAKGLALLIEDPSSPPRERLEMVRLGELFVRRSFADSPSLIDALVNFAIASIIEVPSRKFLNDHALSLTDAKALLANLPEIEKETRLEKTIVSEFQSSVYTYLPDPAEYFKKSTAAAIASDLSDVGKEDSDPPGNYDALTTAKEFSDIAVEEIRNSELPLGKISTPAAERLVKLSGTLPQENIEDKQGFALWWAKLSYRYRMGIIPNSFAYLIAPYSDVKSIVKLRDEARVWNRLRRLQLACDIYAGEKGHFPGSLSELASEKILATIPGDPFSELPLHYDPKRGVIWSVGLDMTDDNASETKMGSRPQDFVVHLRPCKAN